MAEGEFLKLGKQPVKVWSLIVSLFGDVASEPGAEINGQSLTALMEAMSVRPEATRVAIHRLRKDGWIVSRKVGRTAHYSLSQTALKETQAASLRIYAKRIEHRPQKLVMMPPDATEDLVENSSGIEISPRVWLLENMPDRGWLLEPKASDWPHWVTDILLPPERATEFDDLAKRVAQIPVPALVNPIDQACLRASIVHAWRRLVLRLPESTEPALPLENSIAHCRRAVMDVLSSVNRPTLESLHECANGLHPVQVPRNSTVEPVNSKSP